MDASGTPPTTTSSEEDLVRRHLDQSLGNYRSLSTLVRWTLVTLAGVVVVAVLTALVLIVLTLMSDVAASKQVGLAAIEGGVTAMSAAIWKMFSPMLDRFRDELGKFERSIMQLFAIERSAHAEVHIAWAVALTNAADPKERGEIAREISQWARGLDA